MKVADALFSLFVAVNTPTGVIERPEQFELTEAQCTQAAQKAIEAPDVSYARCRPWSSKDVLEPDWVDPAGTAVLALPSGRIVRLYQDKQGNWPLPYDITEDDASALTEMMEPVR